MVRFLTALTSAVALVALVAAPAIAQTQQPTYPAPGSAAPGGAGAPARGGEKPAVAEKPAIKEVEGTVKKVDAAAKSVQVSSGVLGLFGATLEVADDTQIQIEGKQGSLADIREGARVKASYESRDGKNMAKSIEVLPAEEKKDKGASPARPAVPPMGVAPAPSAEPKTQ